MRSQVGGVGAERTNLVLTVDVFSVGMIKVDVGRRRGKSNIQYVYSCNVWYNVNEMWIRVHMIMRW